jgi:hypothetical protein
MQRKNLQDCMLVVVLEYATLKDKYEVSSKEAKTFVATL